MIQGVIDVITKLVAALMFCLYTTCSLAQEDYPKYPDTCDNFAQLMFYVVYIKKEKIWTRSETIKEYRAHFEKSGLTEERIEYILEFVKEAWDTGRYDPMDMYSEYLPKCGLEN